MERKKRYTRTYRESYFVLTPAGFLHEYATSDPKAHGGQTPMFSLFLPACTLGPPAAASAKSHKFHIEGTKDGQGTIKSGSIRAKLRGGGHAWSFRARSHEDMLEWWNDLKLLTARYLVASEQMDRSGPIAAAVRSAGYASESGSDISDEEGSSVEEEEEEERYAEAQDGEASPPGYTGPHKNVPVEIGPNGYAVRHFVNSAIRC